VAALRALAVVGAYVLAAALVLVGIVLFALSDGCFDYCDEPNPLSERWYWGAWVLVPIWGLMYGALRALGRRPAAWRALLLTGYLGTVVALASWFSENEVISGDGAWIGFWVVTLVGWGVLTAVLARHPADER
jgi:hypothetical protein